MLKTCKKCNIEKDIGCFYKRLDRNGGAAEGRCRECRRKDAMARNRSRGVLPRISLGLGHSNPAYMHLYHKTTTIQKNYMALNKIKLDEKLKAHGNIAMKLYTSTPKSDPWHIDAIIKEARRNNASFNPDYKLIGGLMDAMKESGILLERPRKGFFIRAQVSESKPPMEKIMVEKAMANNTATSAFDAIAKGISDGLLFARDFRVMAVAEMDYIESIKIAATDNNTKLLAAEKWVNGMLKLLESVALEFQEMKERKEAQVITEDERQLLMLMKKVAGK